MPNVPSGFITAAATRFGALPVGTSRNGRLKVAVAPKVFTPSTTAGALATRLVTACTSTMAPGAACWCAIDVRVKKKDREVKQTDAAKTKDKHAYARTDLESSIELINNTGKPIEIEVKRYVLGEVDKLLALPERPEVIYLDPMFPHKQKSALVKKEMRVFQSLVGADLDADALLPAALRMADKRVVVKRPDYAGWLNEHKPSMAIETKSNRFDVYVMAALAG